MPHELNHDANPFRHGDRFASAVWQPLDALPLDPGAPHPACRGGERFQLYVQPIVSLDADCAVTHYETLLRLIDENGDVRSPLTFMPLLEQLGLMPLVDRWVVREALTWWRLHGAGVNGAGRLAINLSPASLSDPDMTTDLMRVMRETDVDPAQLIFEITEGRPLPDLARAAALLTELRRAGAEAALDDFGTGHASFHYLKALPLDYLKAAGTFVRHLNDDPVDLAFVASMNLLGHDLGLRTVAEFVETPSILEAVRGLGIDFAQGFEIARPRPIQSLLAA